MSTYKLYYFNARGRAEVSRLIFVAAGQKFEDIRHEGSEWLSYKSEMPLGQMPVLEVDGVKLPQSLSIARFLAKQFNLAGKDNLEQAKVDAVADTIADGMAKFGPIRREVDEAKKQADMEKFLDDELPKHLQNLEVLAKAYSNGSSFFVGNHLTWCDLLVYDMLENILHIDASALNRYSWLQRNHRGTFHQLLKSVTDPWADLPSEHSTEATIRTLRESVMEFYNLKRNWCMVVGKINKKSKHVVTAHTYPKSEPTDLQFFDLNSSDIDNPRNCLRLTKEIERAFDTKNLTIIEKSGQLRIFLLNKTMSSKIIAHVSYHTFGSTHGSPLIFNNEKRPFHTLLVLDCYCSFNNARLKQQEFSLNSEDLNNIVFYVENLLDISLESQKWHNVKQWLYNNPVGPDAPSLQSQTMTQFIYEFVEQYSEIHRICPSVII
ncbi:unnamed protein product [Rotaria sp. Silwood2]|nr:unnamed protein product [Rotaria sp. Silwood2]CAF4125401.1 unnamed protein product [Rotaria sp. Silwood2]